MNIIEIINTNHIFGFGQISHNPRDYYLDNNGSLYNWIKGEPDAIIKCERYDIDIKLASGFCLQIATADGWRITVSKQLINTASPECCVAAAEEQLRLIELIKKPINQLRAHREAAGLSRAQLGELSGVHPQNIARWELGERDLRNASYDTVIKLAKALQYKPEDII
jgi:DNA-binding XRE family transcriptional regulator